MFFSRIYAGRDGLTAPPEPQGSDCARVDSQNRTPKRRLAPSLPVPHADSQARTLLSLTVEILRDGAVSQKTRDERNAILHANRS